MQGRLENQVKIERQIENLLKEMPRVVSEYYMNFSINREFRSCLVYIQKIKMFLTFYAEENDVDIMDINFDGITDLDISRFLKSIETKTNAKGDVKYTSFSYRKMTWSVLNSFFAFLYKKGYTKSNPLDVIERPTKNDKVDHVFLQKEDLDKIIEAIKRGAGTEKAINCQNKWKERDMAIFFTFICTGMRESALCEIDMNKIDFKNNILEVVDKEHKQNTYTISPLLKKKLVKWMNKREILLGNEECDALFISNRKSRINAHSVIHLINKYSQEGLGYKVSPHRLRAAFCNLMYEETHDIEFTSQTMKHKNVSTTRIYIETNEKKVNDKSAKIIDSLF